ERDLLPTEGVSLTCEQCSKKKDNGLERFNCCAQKIMTLQPDFHEQRSILEEAVIKAGHIFERYPKYHCEYNFIERYWGFVKQKIRKSCTYNYADLLKKISEVLTSVPVTTIRNLLAS